MTPVTLGLIQANLRNAFSEKHPELLKVSDHRDALTQDDIDHNQRKIVDLIRQTVAAGAELVVTPESYLDGWSLDAEILNQYATTADGPYVKELRALASELGVWICCGVCVREEEIVFNEAILIDSSGAIAHEYRKTHETADVLRRIPQFSLGQELSVASTPWGRVGMLVCHDRWYPENYRTLRLKGAELILNPTATATFWPGHPYYDIHRCTLRAHAYANGLFVASCNGIHHGGHSVVVAPDGSVISEGSLETEVVLCRVSPSEYSSYDFVSSLNPDLYWQKSLFENKSVIGTTERKEGQR